MPERIRASGFDPSAADERRFWSHVRKGRRCWLWTASTFASGRGQFKLRGRNLQAHRVAWVLDRHEQPHGLLRSACGNARCVRPEHQLEVERKTGPASLTQTVERRFEALVTHTAGCWEWRGSVDRTGFGQFSVGAGAIRRMVRAHRFAFEQTNGPIPKGMEVSHSCANRRCVRPDHLELRDPRERLHFPTGLQMTILRAVAAHGSRRGSLKRVASELGLAHHTVVNEVWKARRRVGTSSTASVIDWLDQNAPGWRAA